MAAWMLAGGAFTPGPAACRDLLGALRAENAVSAYNGGMGVRLDRRDWVWVGVAIVVAAVSLLVVRADFHRAFPQAAIDFEVSGPGSEPVAAAFLRARGLSPAGFQHAEQFGYDDNGLTFLERELGLERAEALLRTRVAMWRWQHRWFRPLDKEEFRVAVATSGQVVAFDHAVPDAAPGASLSEGQARALAEQFLAGVMHADWRTWVAVGAERTVRPHRTDYTFTWRDRALIARAEHRHEVRVQGGEVAAYEQYIKVPQAWQRSYDRLRSKNNTAGEMDSGMMLVLFLALLAVVVMRIRRNDLRWRTAFWVGGVGAGLSFLAALNSMGAARFDYNTTQTWSAFVSGQLLGALASAVGVGVFLALLTAGAESLYRERFTGQVSVSSFLSWRGVRTKAFFLSMVLGLALAAFFFAYQTVFYLIANHFGAWAPADIPYDDLLNTKLPWAFVLFTGFFPAISEEFGFRMFAIPLLEKWFRYLWVAVIAASFLWGFGHATYPNQPFYIRGVEVGLGGVLLSYVMIRFGILTTVVWHYTVDALYTAMLLLRAHDAYLFWSGAATALLAVAPLAAAIVAYRVRGGFVAEDDLTNAAAGSRTGKAAAAAAEPAPGQEPAGAGPASYEPIAGQNWTTGLIVAAALLAAFAVPTVRWATVLPWRVSRGEAVARARAFLRAEGQDVSGYRAVATQGTAAAARHGEENQIAASDLFARGGRRAVQAAFSGAAPTVAAEFWRVRFYRAGQTEEFQVALRADSGAVTAYLHTLAETAPGAAPTLPAAEARAAAFLAARGFAVDGMELKTAQQQKLPARTDTTLVWEAKTPPGLRVEADLAGDRVSYFAAWHHVPEARVRAYERGTLGGTLLGLARGLLYAAASALVLGLLFVFARRQQLAWGAVLKLAAAAGVVTLAMTANSLASAWAAYPTDTPRAAFLLTLGLGAVVAAAGGFLLTLGLTAPLAITAPKAAALTRANARRQLERETAWDALWVGLLSLAWVTGWGRVQTVISTRWHAAGTVGWPTPPAGLTAAVPGLSDLLAAPLHALWIAAGLGILLPVLWRAWHRPTQRAWCVAGIALLWIGRFPAVHGGAQFGLAAIFSALSLLLLFGFGHLFLRDSPLAYLSAALVPALVGPGAQWLLVEAAPAHLVGGIFLALAGGWLAWLAWVARRARPSGEARRARAAG